MNKHQIISILSNKKDYLFETFGLKNLALFGSFARSENHKDSDIDILFEVQENRKFSMFQYLKLNKYLEDNLDAKVDLVREGALKEFIKPYIKKDLIYV